MLTGNYVGCSISVFDTSGQIITKTTITTHDSKKSEITLASYHDMRDGAHYRVRIIYMGAPYEFMGRATIVGHLPCYLALYKGKPAEARKSPRHDINLVAAIESYVYNNIAFQLHTNIPVRLINISSGGARLIAYGNAMSVGDSFEMTLNMGGKIEKLLVEVRNQSSYPGDNINGYGCQFLASTVEIERVV
jgi:hypothetical protein